MVAARLHVEHVLVAQHWRLARLGAGEGKEDEEHGGSPFSDAPGVPLVKVGDHHRRRLHLHRPKASEGRRGRVVGAGSSSLQVTIPREQCRGDAAFRWRRGRDRWMTAGSPRGTGTKARLDRFMLIITARFGGLCFAARGI
eukprot:scaffold1620_cov233-Pinguiococcus_pyrenoidosus.AAC.13